MQAFWQRQDARLLLLSALSRIPAALFSEQPPRRQFLWHLFSHLGGTAKGKSRGIRLISCADPSFSIQEHYQRACATNVLIVLLEDLAQFPPTELPWLLSRLTEPDPLAPTLWFSFDRGKNRIDSFQQQYPQFPIHCPCKIVLEEDLPFDLFSLLFDAASKTPGLPPLPRNPFRSSRRLLSSRLLSISSKLPKIPIPQSVREQLWTLGNSRQSISPAAWRQIAQVLRTSAYYNSRPGTRNVSVGPNDLAAVFSLLYPNRSEDCTTPLDQLENRLQKLEDNLKKAGTAETDAPAIRFHPPINGHFCLLSAEEFESILPGQQGMISIHKENGQRSGPYLCTHLSADSFQLSNPYNGYQIETYQLERTDLTIKPHSLREDFFVKELREIQRTLESHHRLQQQRIQTAENFFVVPDTERCLEKSQQQFASLQNRLQLLLNRFL